MKDPRRKTIEHHSLDGDGNDVVESYEFEMVPLGFKDGRALFVRLVKQAGPALLALADKSPSLKSLGSKPVESLHQAIKELSDSDLEWASDLLGKTTKIIRPDGKTPYLHAPVREELFGGRLVLFFAWLWFGLEVNFSDFSAAFRSANNAPAPGAETPASSQG